MPEQQHFVSIWVGLAWTAGDCVQCKKQNVPCVRPTRRLNKTSVEFHMCTTCEQKGLKCEVPHPCSVCLETHRDCSMHLTGDEKASEACQACQARGVEDRCKSIAEAGFEGFSDAFLALFESSRWKSHAGSNEARSAIQRRWLHDDEGQQTGSDLWRTLMDMFRTPHLPAVKRLVRGHVDRHPGAALCVAMNNWIADTRAETGESSKFSAEADADG